MSKMIIFCQNILICINKGGSLRKWMNFRKHSETGGRRGGGISNLKIVVLVVFFSGKFIYFIEARRPQEEST